MSAYLITFIFFIVCARRVYSYNLDSFLTVLRSYNISFDTNLLLYSGNQTKQSFLSLIEIWSDNPQVSRDFLKSQIGNAIDQKILSFYNSAKINFDEAESTKQSLFSRMDEITDHIQRLDKFVDYIPSGLNITLYSLYSVNQLMKECIEASQIINTTYFERAQYYQAIWETKAMLERINNLQEFWSELALKKDFIQKTLINSRKQSEHVGIILSQANSSLISLKAQIRRLDGRNRQRNDDSVYFTFSVFENINQAYTASLALHQGLQTVQYAVENLGIKINVNIWEIQTASNAIKQLTQISTLKEELLDQIRQIKKDQITIRKAEELIKSKIAQLDVDHSELQSPLKARFQEFDEFEILLKQDKIDDDVTTLLRKITEQQEELNKLKSTKPQNEFLNTNQTENNTSELNQIKKETYKKNTPLWEQIIKEEVQKRMSEERNKESEIQDLKKTIEEQKYLFSLCQNYKNKYKDNTLELKMLLSKIFDQILPEIPEIELYYESFETLEKDETKSIMFIAIDQLPSPLKDLIKEKQGQTKYGTLAQALIDRISYCSIDDDRVAYEQARNIIETSVSHKEDKLNAIFEIDVAIGLLNEMLRQIECTKEQRKDTVKLQLYCKDLTRSNISSFIIQRNNVVEKMMLLIKITSHNSDRIESLDNYPSNEYEALSFKFELYLKSLLNQFLITKATLLNSNQRTCLFEIFSGQLWKNYHNTNKN